MSINSVGQGSVTLSSSSAMGKLASDYDSFITLLVAQVKNQDPLAPMESTEFVSQLAQLTQVEQSVKVNSHLESLRQQLALNAALSETGLIGRQVMVPTDRFAVGPMGGSFSYKLSDAAAIVQAQIHDASGTLVATISGLSGTGGTLHEVTWDGKGTNGEQVAAGSYYMSIAATDADGNGAGSYQSYASGMVEVVDFEGGETWLRLADGNRVQSGEIVGAR